jgi:hypothetical protein
MTHGKSSTTITVAVPTVDTDSLAATASAKAAGWKEKILGAGRSAAGQAQGYADEYTKGNKNKKQTSATPSGKSIFVGSLVPLILAATALALALAYQRGLLDPYIRMISEKIFKAKAVAEKKKLESQGKKEGRDFVEGSYFLSTSIFNTYTDRDAGQLSGNQQAAQAAQGNLGKESLGGFRENARDLGQGLGDTNISSARDNAGLDPRRRL